MIRSFDNYLYQNENHKEVLIFRGWYFNLYRVIAHKYIDGDLYNPIHM